MLRLRDARPSLRKSYPWRQSFKIKLDNAGPKYQEN